ncbi:SIMPL domain-containing protein [Chloroflexota bacterium]
MKKKWFFLIAAIIPILAVTVLTGCGQTTADLGEITQLSVSSQQQGIWVSGQGEVSAVPDIATLRLGIEAEEAGVAEAQSKATEAMNDVLDALKSNGIADKDIQVQQFSIRRVTRWDRDKEEEVVTGYRVTHIVTAKIRDIDKAGTIIDEVAEAGGNLTRIDSINFSIDDPTDYYEEAREEAVKDAEAKAKQLASLAGVSLGKATYISESSYSQPVYSRAVYDIAVEEAEAGTSISPGELDINISIQVAYSIR